MSRSQPAPSNRLEGWTPSPDPQPFDWRTEPGLLNRDSYNTDRPVKLDDSIPAPSTATRSWDRHDRMVKRWQNMSDSDYYDDHEEQFEIYGDYLSDTNA